MSEAIHLSPAEIADLQGSGLSRETPFVIRGVSHGFFSVARYYGGATYNGSRYTYFPATDELVRDDVLAWLKRRRRMPRKAKAPEMFP